jgi:hypothetical protein
VTPVVTCIPSKIEDGGHFIPFDQARYEKTVKEYDV